MTGPARKNQSRLPYIWPGEKLRPGPRAPELGRHWLVYFYEIVVGQSILKEMICLPQIMEEE